MALSVTRSSGRLDLPFVLAPERYDPRRTPTTLAASILLSEVVGVAKESIQPSQCTVPCVVLDTSDTYEGFVIARKASTQEIGSAKKIAKPGDVIISRLRPYLKQVAYVDADITDENTLLLCSTEFFVLRSRDDESIAFLVPFLLSQPIQKALAASQEGGHHPRFQESTLLSLPLPAQVIHQRTSVSAHIKQSAATRRKLELEMNGLIASAEAAFASKSDAPE